MSEAATSASTTTSEQSSAARPALRHGVLGLPHAIVISVAVMSPAASIFFNTIPQAGLGGAAGPPRFPLRLFLGAAGRQHAIEAPPRAPPLDARRALLSRSHRP